MNRLRPDLPGSTIDLVPKATSAKPGSSSPSRSSAAGSTERNANKVVESARQEATRLRSEAKADAARMREEAEEHARRLVLDARALADGVRAEGMEVVSNLRQISDTLRELSERVLEDVEAIHTRMVGELEGVDSGSRAPVAPDAESSPPAVEEPAGSSSAEDELDVPDFVQPR